MIKVIKTSIFTNKQNEMLLPITHEQLKRWQDGELIQNVFPHLNEDQREFMVTGATPQEWRDFMEVDCGAINQ